MPDESSTPGDAQSRLATWTGAVTGVVPTALAIFSATTGQLEGLGLMALAIVPWAAIIARPRWPKHQYVLAAALSATFTAIAVYALWGPGNPGPKDSNEQLKKAAAQLKFLKPPERIPHCATFNGTGTIPAQDDLVLFDRPSDAYGNYTHTPAFGYDWTADSQGNGWTAPNREIGSGDPSDNGTHIAIVAVLVPKSTAHFLDDLTSDSDTGQLPASVMSLGVQADKITITRNSQNAHCPQ